jgi:membrane fusion protein (multidrug efflux system)
LFTLTDLDKLKADVNLPEKDIQLLNNIIGIEVVADAIPGQIFKAKLRKISGAVDLATRTMEVEIDIINADNLLKPGMFVKIFLILEKKSNVLILPDFVIQNDQTGDFVFIVNSNNTVTKRLIKKGILQDNKYEILSGITENDPLVFSGQNVLNDGSAIKITK